MKNVIKHLVEINYKMFKKNIYAHSILMITILCVVELQNVHADGSIIGPHGLILTPSATLPMNRQVRLGFSRINTPYVFLEGSNVSENFLFYSSLVYLPRLEVTLLITTAPGRPGNDGSGTYKDAAVFVQYFAVTEKKFFPAISIGAYDFYSFSFYNALYIVFSKGLNAIFRLPLRAHLGYGVNWLDKHYGDTATDRNSPVPHNLVGLFAGLEFELFKHLNLTFEYDSEKFNGGVRFNVFDRIQFFGTLLNFTTFSGGLSYKFII